MPDINTLVADIYSLFDPDKDHVINEDNLNDFAEGLKDVIRQRFRQAHAPVDGYALRFSSLGKQNRQIYYDSHPIEGGKEKLIPKTYLKFLFGDLYEQLVVLLIKEAGHEITHTQAEVEVDGIKGHTDGIVDGVVVDIKSASPFGYKKFKEGTVTQDDPFGYVAQLAGYADVLTPGKAAAWIAIDKVHGDICVSPLSRIVIEHHKPLPRIIELKEIIDAEAPPERCYDPIPDGKSGNMRLDTGCSYCSHKFRCHPGLRTFLYSNGPRYLTSVVKVPDVPEVNHGNIETETPPE